MHSSSAETPWEHRPAAVASELVGARALREWLVGDTQEFTRVFVIDSGAAESLVQCVVDVAGDADAVLMSAQDRSYSGRGTVITYDGAFIEIGDELYLGGRGVELQDYVAASFVQIVGPTAVGMFDPSSWRAFLDDADIARRTGVFPSALLDPRVLLANRSAMTAPDVVGSPRAIGVAADGQLRLGVRGEVIGTVDELADVLTHPWPATAAWRGIDTRERLSSTLTSRPWLGRYLNAAELLKMLRVQNAAVQISGFGWAIDDDGHADAEPQTTDPFLLETAQGFVLADIVTLRRQLLSPTTARVVEAVQSSSTLETAVDRLMRLLDIQAAAADELCRDAVAALGIHVGSRSDAESCAMGELE